MTIIIFEINTEGFQVPELYSRKHSSNAGSSNPTAIKITIVIIISLSQPKPANQFKSLKISDYPYENTMKQHQPKGEKVHQMNLQKWI